MTGGCDRRAGAAGAPTSGPRRSSGSPERPRQVGRPGYRGGMTRQGTPEGTPSEHEVAHDFTVPGDADLRPVTDEGDVDGDEGDGS